MHGMKELLSKIEDGGTIDDLAAELNMNKSTVLAMIEFMLDEGYLEVVKVHCGCSASPGLGCGCNTKCDSETKIYVLTEKGRYLVSERK